MVTSDWINLIAAILVGGGTLFLGIMAWRNIRQTRSIQKSEKRERLLNEIIDWATEVADIGFEESIISLPDARDGSVDQYDMQKMILSKLSSVYSKCKAIESRSTYISFISQKFDKELHKYVSDVYFKIDNLEKLLAKSIEEDKGISIPHGDELIKVKTSAHKLIEEATKIKIRDIG